MTSERKKEILDNIMVLLVQLTDDESIKNTADNTSVELITIKECTAVIKGLSENTVRQLVAQKKIKSVRTGRGSRGKILVNKNELLNYFS